MFHPRRTSRRTQAGITLTEVMIGMVLVGLLMVGVNGLWVMVSRSFDDVWLRQKAIFRINGEMERLSSLYITSAGPTSPVHVTDYATTGAPTQRGSYIADTVTGNRAIYAATQTNVTTNTTMFETAVLNDGTNLNEVYRQIYYYDNGSGATGDDRNLVWLDRERSIVAQISWELLPLANTGSGGSNACYMGACQLLTLYLDYPFRYSTASPRGDMGPVETITLQTIVGQRQ